MMSPLMGSDGRVDFKPATVSTALLIAVAIGRSGRTRCVAQYLLNLLLVHVQLSHLRRRSVTTSVKLEPLVLVPLPTVGVAQSLFSVPRAVIKRR